MNDNPFLSRLSELYEQAPCGFVVTLGDGRILHANITFTEWLGYAQGGMNEGDLRFQDLLTLPARLFYENQFAPMLAVQESVREVALDLAGADGGVLRCLVNAVRLPGIGDGPMLDAYVVFDATERRRYEAELQAMRRHAEELASVVNAVQDAILSVSPSGQVQTYNDAARRLFGAYHGELNGRPLSEILRLGERSGEANEIWSQLERGQAVRHDAIAVTAQSQEIEVAASLSPHLSELGALVSVACVLSDISERKHLEQMQRDYLATASHELRNPLAVLRGRLQLLHRREELSDESFGVLREEIDQLERLVEDLHVANEAQLRHLDMRWEDVDLVAEVEQLRDLPLQGHVVSVSTTLASLVVPADRSRLRQVLANLLSNAAKYSSPEHSIDIVLDASDDVARISVTDHGPGIPEHDRMHIFERFFRSNGPTRSERGLGLGLFVVRRIMEAHGGEITVHSELDVGSTFTLRLPRQRA